MRIKNLLSMIKLNSVSCCIDKDTLLIYPLLIGGEIDKDNPVHLMDVSDDWIRSLSIQDKILLEFKTTEQ